MAYLKFTLRKTISGGEVNRGIISNIASDVKGTSMYDVNVIMHALSSLNRKTSEDFLPATFPYTLFDFTSSESASEFAYDMPVEF